MSGSEAMIDKETGTVIINDTAIPNQAVMDALTVQHPEIAALVNWSRRTQEVGRHGGIFQRDRYLTPATIFDQFKIALDAVETDDVVSGVMETTESLAFNNIIIDCDDEDERDVWNQILEDIDFYTRAREMWRELFSVSQYYAATYWVRKDYKVRGKTKGGNRKKKEFRNLLVPGGITLLDPLKVVPVGNFMFGKEQLAYIADRDQVARFDDVLANKNTTDLVVEQLLIGKYTPNKAEKKYLHNITGKNVDNLYLLNPNNVWRHTATRPAYQRFATVRMKSIFEILDLKQQLRQMDRAHLIGGTNFIVLVKKGSDQRPATPQEMHSLANQVKMASRVPVIVGDHRLEVEIVTPKMDFVLIAEKYNALDSRITARLFQMFMCVDEETEAFTIDGWKKHSELQVDDLILTLNTETGLSEWLPVQDIKKYDVDMDLWFMESQSHSSFTTPNHRWWTYQRSSLPHLSRWQWRQSSELTAASCIPLAVPHAQLPTEPKFSDAFVELVAWYITEGSDKCDSDGVQIAQSQDVNPAHCAQIRRALTEVFGPEGYAPDGLWHQSPSGMAFELRAEAGRALREVAPNKVPRQEVLLNLTQAQLELFIDRCIDADGCLSDRVKNEKILDAFIFACILAGKPVSRKRHSDTVDKVTILKNSFTRPISAAGQSDDSVAEYRPYKGVVWCPHTPNMTFLARRNGHMYWTGNTGNYSAGAKGDDSIKLARVVARGMETRRNMIGLNTLRNLILPTFRKNEQFTEEPSIQFQPRRIALDFDPNVLNFLQELRDRGDLSRETILSEMDISQDKEARNRKTEEELYDETFKPPMIMLPPGTPGGPPAPPEPQETGPTAPRGSGATTNKTGKTNGGGKAAGRSGGRKGGANRDSFNSNPGRGPSKSMLEGMSTDELNDLIDTALQMLSE